MASHLMLPQTAKASDRRSREEQRQALEFSPTCGTRGLQSPMDSFFDPTCCQSPIDRFFDGTQKAVFFSATPQKAEAPANSAGATPPLASAVAAPAPAAQFPGLGGGFAHFA